ncbi:MAG: four-carbon acid sugar kinase family protein [Beutenbergiaceae bacterium]
MTGEVTLVLDDDPTGTQSATGVEVLLQWDADRFADVVAQNDSVYVLTNTRAVPQAEAVALIERIRDESTVQAQRLGLRVRYVLRGDSTLRGHVFAESEVLMGRDAILAFVPAFPDGGRVTEGGIHYVTVDGARIRADQSEYAQDPVFGFDTADLVEYVNKYGGRAAQLLPLEAVERGADELADALGKMQPGTVALFDAVTNDHVRTIAAAIRASWNRGSRVTVRSASPLAAALAGVESHGLLAPAAGTSPASALVVCGSHTRGASAQLEALKPTAGGAIEVDTDRALDNVEAEGERVAELARLTLARQGVVVVSSARHRRPEDGTLAHGQRVMDALTHVVSRLADEVDVVVAKGGITSADVARVGLGARSARVLGQILPGVSLWQIERGDQAISYAVVPGNVGDQDTLKVVMQRLGVGRGGVDGGLGVGAAE